MSKHNVIHSSPFTSLQGFLLKKLMRPIFSARTAIIIQKKEREEYGYTTDMISIAVLDYHQVVGYS